jgi:hypothetical protein
MKFTSQANRAYSLGSDGYGFMIFDDTQGTVAGYRMVISDVADRLGYTGIGSGLTSPQAQLHVSSSQDVNNHGVFRVDGDAGANLLFVTGSGLVGIGTNTPTATLTVAGSASFSSSAPEGNDVYFGSGNVRRMGALEDQDDDFLMIAHEQGEISLSSSIGVEIIAMNEEGGFSLIGSQMNVFVDDSEDGAITFTIDPTTGNVHTTGSVGIGLPAAATAKVSLDVHYTGSGNPINLDDDKGGGEVVYFGTASAGLTAGGVYYLNTAGGWESANSANTGSGHNQLLGIAMGAKPTVNGVLIKGYFHEDSYFSGSFIKGGPLYIQSSSVGRGPTEGGYISGAAPTATDSYVRVVGYGTDTPNVIYFNPDSTYVEIG